MPDRAKYLALVLCLFVLVIGALLEAYAAIAGRTFLDVIISTWPAIVLSLIATIIHGMRHDLDS